MTLSEALRNVVPTVERSGHAYDIVDTESHGIDWFLHGDRPRTDKGVVLAMVVPVGEMEREYGDDD